MLTAIQARCRREKVASLLPSSDQLVTSVDPAWLCQPTRWATSVNRSAEPQPPSPGDRPGRKPGALKRPRAIDFHRAAAAATLEVVETSAVKGMADQRGPVGTRRARDVAGDLPGAVRVADVVGHSPAQKQST